MAKARIETEYEDFLLVDVPAAGLSNGNGITDIEKKRIVLEDNLHLLAFTELFFAESFQNNENGDKVKDVLRSFFLERVSAGYDALVKKNLAVFDFPLICITRIESLGMIKENMVVELRLTRNGWVCEQYTEIFRTTYGMCRPAKAISIILDLSGGVIDIEMATMLISEFVADGLSLNPFMVRNDIIDASSRGELACFGVKNNFKIEAGLRQIDSDSLELDKNSPNIRVVHGTGKAEFRIGISANPNFLIISPAAHRAVAAYAEEAAKRLST
ncbi:MAG: hypothetical protein Q8L11_00380 [Candidatus Moranbacteria bacterium]|nr:hypothetical protein [bacterium]MDP1833374.1 hypothetical protein [Candidatus Moranbacteria bacterium]